MMDDNVKPEHVPPRFCVNFDVWDNKLQEEVVGDVFNAPEAWMAAEALREAADELDRYEEGRRER